MGQEHVRKNQCIWNDGMLYNPFLWLLATLSTLDRKAHPGKHDVFRDRIMRIRPSFLRDSFPTVTSRCL